MNAFRMFLEDSHSPEVPVLYNSSIFMLRDIISMQKMLMSQLVSQALSMTVIYAAYNFFQLVVKATTLGFSPRVPHGAEPSRGQITPRSPRHTLPPLSGVLIVLPWPSSQMWARGDSVSPSCLPPSGGLSDSPALGLSSVLPLRLPSLGSSLE